jgi:hypothetical protein
MDGLTGQSPLTEERSSLLKPMLAGGALVVVVVAIIVLLSHKEPVVAVGPPAYAANIKILDMKMSTSENFVGSAVTYIDGNVTNAGDKTVTHIVARVTFKDSMDQVAQSETVPLYVIDSSVPYPNPIDLNVAPLAAGKSKPFRITFEHVSNAWNQAYPALEVTDVIAK